MNDLVLMAEARQRDQWDHTAAVIAHIVNGIPFRKEPVKPADYHPFERHARKGGGVRVTDLALMVKNATGQIPRGFKDGSK
ncbi:MAG: hypothetical protein ACYTGL_14740 [Planctomycetota bacterium]|jgi:hypothetical protein